jgi:hypothetical protein
MLGSFGGSIAADMISNLFIDQIPGYIDSSRVTNLPAVPSRVNYATQSQVQLTEMCHWNSIWYIGIGIPLEYLGISEAQVFHGPRGGTRT